MELIIKSYEELTKEELYQIYKLRVEVFIVEQQCYYQEIDEHDKVAYHIYLHDETGILAYARVLPQGATFEDASIGRIIAVKRNIGLGSKIVKEAIAQAKEKFNAVKITIEAQTYAKKLYENFGFIVVSDEFLEDGIPHIRMTLEL